MFTFLGYAAYNCFSVNQVIGEYIETLLRRVCLLPLSNNKKSSKVKTTLNLAGIDLSHFRSATAPRAVLLAKVQIDVILRNAGWSVQLCI